MFEDALQALIAALKRIALLRFIPPDIVVDKLGTSGANIQVDGSQIALGTDTGLRARVYRPDPADPSGEADYRPLDRSPLVVRLSPRVLITDASDGTYDPATVAFACAHALTFTDGALADFLEQDHSLVFTGQGTPPNSAAFEWGTYHLDTLSIVSLGPAEPPPAMELVLQLDGTVWLHPATEPPPQLIQQVFAPLPPISA